MTGSMSQIVARANGHVDNKIRAATSEVFSNIIQMTPVDTGRARGNWQCTIGAPFTGEDDTGDVLKMQNTLPRRAGSVVYLTNNVPYIRKLEYIPGYSRQAPAGMVRVSVALFEGALNGTR
jgi:hypothetical protein